MGEKKFTSKDLVARLKVSADKSAFINYDEFLAGIGEYLRKADYTVAEVATPVDEKVAIRAHRVGEDGTYRFTAVIRPNMQQSFDGIAQLEELKSENAESDADMDFAVVVPMVCSQEQLVDNDKLTTQFRDSAFMLWVYSPLGHSVMCVLGAPKDKSLSENFTFHPGGDFMLPNRKMGK